MPRMSRRSRRTWFVILATLGLATLVAPCVCVVAAVGVPGIWRLTRAAKRVEPVIQAIHSYESDTGQLPADLGVLVPRYLEAADYEPGVRGWSRWRDWRYRTARGGYGARIFHNVNWRGDNLGYIYPQGQPPGWLLSIPDSGQRDELLDIPVPATGWGGPSEMPTYDVLAKGAAPLVAALHAYRAKNGDFPMKLSRLVPDYLGNEVVDVERHAWGWSYWRGWKYRSMIDGFGINYELVRAQERLGYAWNVGGDPRWSVTYCGPDEKRQAWWELSLDPARDKADPGATAEAGEP